MERIVARFKALGDINRFRIIMMLMERQLCVCEMLEVLDIAGGTLSNHLKVLRNAGLIKQRKDGRWIEYYISNQEIREFIGFFAERMVNKGQINADKAKIKTITRDVCSLRKS